MAAVATPELKRLAFVETAAVGAVNYVAGTTAFNKACTYYSSAKETSALKVRAFTCGLRRCRVSGTRRH